MAALYGTGYNTYYWYDMVTNIPNAYFVEVGIYKYVGSPTYTLGRATSFGAAIHYRYASPIKFLFRFRLKINGISGLSPWLLLPYLIWWPSICSITL